MKCTCHLTGVWADVPGNPRYEINLAGEIRNKRTRRKLSPFENPQIGGRPAYLRVSLWTGSKYRGRYVHRLVRRTFDPNVFAADLEVHHPDGDRFHNCFGNTAWAARQHEPFGHPRSNAYEPEPAPF